jgi:hypothetical protein
MQIVSVAALAGIRDAEDDLCLIFREDFDFAGIAPATS